MLANSIHFALVDGCFYKLSYNNKYHTMFLVIIIILFGPGFDIPS